MKRDDTGLDLALGHALLSFETEKGSILEYFIADNRNGRFLALIHGKEFEKFQPRANRSV